MLAAFERVSTLKRMVANSEKASAEEDHWRRTSAAVIGLHGHNKGTIDRYVEQVSKFTGAGITSRVLTEIALCVCPQDDGAQISDIELSKLIARAALTVRIGELSNAIYYNALSPEITISPLGDILFRDDFGEIVVQPMLSRALGDKFIENAPVQKKNYEEPGVIPTTQDKFEPEFWYAWKKEMGLVHWRTKVLPITKQYLLSRRVNISQMFALMMSQRIMPGNSWIYLLCQHGDVGKSHPLALTWMTLSRGGSVEGCPLWRVLF